MSSGSTPSVLIFTFCEHGQANVNLATSYELALAGANVVIASFPPLKPRVARLQEIVSRHSATHPIGKLVGSIRFVECKGTTHMDALANYGGSIVELPHPPGVSGAVASYSLIPFVVAPWPKDEYHASIDHCLNIIADVKPDIVVSDVMFRSTLDACKLTGQKVIVILPNSYKDVASEAQPWLASLWKYPALSSGFLYPLKWWQIPLNIYLNIRLIFILATSSHIKGIQEVRKSRGLSSTFFEQLIPGIKYICPVLPGLDYPLEIPKQIVSCGPIVLPFDPIEQCDPALTQWLDKAPTVMINLGSHMLSDEKFAREMSGALRILLTYHDQRGTGNIQVLWKVKANGDVQKPIDEVIGDEIKAERVKIMPWLDAEPVSILQHPNLVCTVHHGGANSFYEGVWSGVPHIVLPVWYDTFDYSARAEFLNIGLWGSPTSAPGVNAEEFGKALIRVTADTEEAASFKRAAKHWKEVCRRAGNGRQLSCKAILSELGL